MGTVVTTGPGGRIAIPAGIRRRIGLQPGQRVELVVQENSDTVLLRPIPQDLVASLRGSLRGGSMLKELVREHAEEVQRDETGGL